MKFFELIRSRHTVPFGCHLAMIFASPRTADIVSLWLEQLPETFRFNNLSFSRPLALPKALDIYFTYFDEQIHLARIYNGKVIYDFLK